MGRVRPAVPLVTVLSTGVMLLAGCGPPPELRETPAATVPAPPPTPPTTPTPGTPGAPGSVPPGLPGTVSPGSFPEEIAINCGGEPTADDVIDVLRREDMLAPDAEVVEGPFCSGDWQYAVVSAPDLDPLQVVTRGGAGALELITAGTDVCTVEVRIQAPPGIRGAAACGD